MLDEEQINSFIAGALTSILAGCFMGLERQFKGKPAGIKTTALVALGSYVYIFLALQFQGEKSTDMTRIIGDIVTGVGFLGAGVIMQKKEVKQVHGLATAATIWCSAAVGSVAAFGFYEILTIFTLMVVLVNLVMGYLNGKVQEKDELTQ